MATPPPLNGKQRRKPSGTEILVVNLSMPGMGTVQAGQKVHGYLQFATAIIGFALTIYFGGWFVWEWYRTGVFPTSILLETGVLPQSWIKPLIVGVTGIVVFLISVTWAFVTSLVIINRMKKTSVSPQADGD